MALRITIRPGKHRGLEADARDGAWRRRWQVPSEILAKGRNAKDRERLARQWAERKYDELRGLGNVETAKIPAGRSLTNREKRLAAKNQEREEIASGPTILDVADQFRRESFISKETREQYYRNAKNWLAPFFKDRSVKSITDDDVNALAHFLLEDAISKHTKQQLGKGTIENILASLSKIMKFAKKKKLITNVPAVDDDLDLSAAIVKKKVNHSADTLQTILKAARKINAAHEVLILLGVDCGMRVSEIAGLQWQNVDLENNEIYICEQLTPKGNRKPPKNNSIGYVPISKRLAIALKKLGVKTEGSVSNMTYGQAGAAYRRIMIAANKLNSEIKVSTRTHELRHTFSTNLAAITRGDESKVSHYCRHKSVQTTRIYIHHSKNNDDRKYFDALAGDNEPDAAE